MKPILMLSLVLIFITGCIQAQTVTMTEETTEESLEETTAGSHTINADVWADNWFAFYLGDELIKEDSVSITTERSFNSESFSFTADYPLVLNFIAKDFKENDTGLEYIGSNRQQMGDGGIIFQFWNPETNAVIAESNSEWMCTVIHDAPSDKSCEQENNPVAGQGVCGFTATEEPEGWMLAGFDTGLEGNGNWANATVHSTAAVSPKQGYDQVYWSPTAEFIWGPDLETNNTVLCTLTVEAPQ